MEELTSLVHWSFFATSLFIAVVVKFILMLKEKFLSGKKWTVILDERFLPLVLGSIVGCVPNIPAPEIVGESVSFGHVLYFSMAGIFGAWIYNIFERIASVLPDELHHFIEKRLGTEGDRKDSSKPQTKEDPGIQDDSSD